MRSKAKFKPTSVPSFGILPAVRTGHSLTLNARYGTSSAIDEAEEQRANCGTGCGSLRDLYGRLR
jgi:hypothetical protein